MRTGSTLIYLLGDHLGSTSMVTDSSGALLMETRYKPFGEVRYATTGQTLPTRYTFTGQYSYVSDEATDAAGFGLMFFNARFYDPSLGRFSSADTIVPGVGDSQAWDRYAFVNNNPVRYIDPSGHAFCQGYEGSCAGGSGRAGGRSGGFVGDDWYNGAYVPERWLGSAIGIHSKVVGEPYIWETNDVIIIIMPAGSNPTQPRPDGLRRIGMALSIVGLEFDVGEMVGIFTSGVGSADFIALGDLTVTTIATLAAGQSYLLDQPNPSLPTMVGVNQDVMVTAADLFFAAGAKGIGSLIGGPVGAGFGMATDAVTTGASIAYDYSRVYGTMPNYLTAGISVDAGSFLKPIVIIWP